MSGEGCEPGCEPTGTVSSVPPQPGRHASTVVCADPGHRAAAGRWVESSTGLPAVYQDFEAQPESSFVGPPEIGHATPVAGDAGIGAGGQEFVYEAAGWEPVPDPEARHAVSEPAIEAGA